MLRERLDRDGFVVVEDALDPLEVEHLNAAVERVRRAEARDGEALHRLAFLGLDDAFLDLVDHPAALPLVRDVLGWNIYVYHCHLDVHPPLAADAEPEWRWHQDGGRQNVELESPRPRLSLKVAWFLTDVPTPEHGALRVVPGSHLRDTLARGLEPEGAVPLLVRAGTAVVVDRRLWHARGDNRSDTTRRVLFYAYTHRWIRPRDDVRAVFFAFDAEDALRMRRDWRSAGVTLPIDVVEAPYRDLGDPLREYLRELTAEPGTIAAVVMPEIVVHGWARLLHNQRALYVKRLLLFEPHVVLASVPYQLP